LYYGELDSTSDEARRVLSGDGEAEPLPLLIVADRQTRGRGRGSNSWYSDTGSLTFTLVLDPAAHRLRPEQEACLALIAACAICQMLESEWLDFGAAEIRWPNDVEVEGRKLAGVLLERVASPLGPRLLLGVGLNVSTDLSQSPAEVQRVATSLEACTRCRVPDSPSALLAPLLQALQQRIEQASRGEPALPELWQARDSLRGRPVRIRLPDRVLEGTGAGIDAGGRLLVGTSAGIEALMGGIVLR
jgi:BirA family biotin operon repressor/biotin-[acetyl-CoA-carboxylase] ligase